VRAEADGLTNGLAVPSADGARWWCSMSALAKLVPLSWLFVACVLSMLATLAQATDALAQGNDLDSPTAARSTLMGNTGVALGRDGAAPFYNPATIVRIRDQRLTFSVHFYSLTLSDFERWHKPGAIDAAQFQDRQFGNTMLSDTSFHSLPSTLCLFFTLEQLAKLPSEGVGKGAAKDNDKANDKAKSSSDHDDRESERARANDEPTGKKLAFCLASLESEDIDLQAIRFHGETVAGPTTQVQSVQRRWNRMYIGPTYSVSLNDHFALGASLHFVYSYQSHGLNSDSLTADMTGGGIASSLTSSSAGKSVDLTGVLGATYRFDRVTLGASVRLPAVHLFGGYDATFSRSYTGQTTASEVVDATGRMSSAPPTRVALGAGIAWERLTLEIDGALVLPWQDVISTDLHVTTTTLKDAALAQVRSTESHSVGGHVTFNPGAGLEFFLTPRLSLLGGISSNFTSIGRLKPQPILGNLIQARANHVTAAFGVGSYWREGELLVGVQLDYGWGEALAANPYVIPNDWSVVGLRTYSLLFVISGSTKLSSIVRTVSNIVEGGGPDKAKKPAQDAEGVPLNKGR